MPSPTPTLSNVFIVQVRVDESVQSLVSTAARAAFGQPQITRTDTLEAATEGGHGPTLLVLQDPTPEVLEKAVTVLSTDRLPRWGVVVFADGSAAALPSSVAVLPREDWNVGIVKHVLRLAALQQTLRRDNAELRQDFATYGQRVAHDLRTPLGGVLTSTEMLREVLSDDSPSNVPFTAPILESAEGLVQLIDRISFLAKANSIRDKAEVLDMGSVFWNAFQKLESRLLKAGATVNQPPSWPKVRGHGSSLEAVWRNLLMNSIEHGGAGVRIDVGSDQVPEGHRFWLTDSGRVAPEKRGTLFYPFHRLHEPGAPRGLGLPIVRRLVEIDGGSCGYEETPPGQSRFYFTLPAA